jgi:hypothetical protein
LSDDLPEHEAVLYGDWNLSVNVALAFFALIKMEPEFNARALQSRFPATIDFKKSWNKTVTLEAVSLPELWRR